MRLHLLSDLHLEFAGFTPPKVQADVVVLSGDIHVGREALPWIQESFPATPVVYVLGNHEFYRNAIPELTHILQSETSGSHIHVLENNVLELGRIRILGCTLWTDFQMAGSAHLAQFAAEDIMSDYHVVQLSPSFRTLRASDTAAFHGQSLKWLTAELAQSNPARTVIVTHHAPSPRSIPPAFAGQLLNSAFASNLESLITAFKPALWIHGHTHHCVDYRLGQTRIISNQRGYPDERLPAFTPGLIVEI